MSSRLIMETLQSEFADHLAKIYVQHEDEIQVELLSERLDWLPKICLFVHHQWKAFFVSAWASDGCKQEHQFKLHYLFSLDNEKLFLVIHAPVSADQPDFPSVAAHLIAANWAEREIQDTFGLTAVGHPNPKALWSHPDWPSSTFAMRKDFSIHSNPTRVDGDFPIASVEGEGVLEIPVGPIHAGIIEPGHFRFSVAGEPIIRLQAQLFYTHKGTEKLAEGLSPERVLHLSERVSGDSTFGHSTAFCHAVERMCGLTIPERAQSLRILCLELERIHNHLSDIGMIANDVAFLIGYAHAMRVREDVMSLNERLWGSRLIRGVNALGGVRRDLSLSIIPEIKSLMIKVREELRELDQILMNSASVVDRLETTGILHQSTAKDIGIVGIAGRASGLDRDFRRDHPHLGYSRLTFNVPTRQTGDVMARTQVRIDEVMESTQIIEQILQKIPDGPIKISTPELPKSAFALGYCEGWRGPILHALETDSHGAITRYKIDDPSFHNWPALLFAVQGNIVPDFPLINKSFNLSYSGNDR
ncbi:NADH-quinone oxidoreductase subunit C [Candidatus Acetothermia bacterium]|nr:NADH-quinone oxidoreductase subunit C [Candidatus Acetothermia bacterium]MBI3644065.1 NADH-quinone oxidoreductase subunit C [Candidatus Acetothermia bacterium]